jgi:hypothetical protein
LGVYKVKGITKKEFVANAVQVKMQHYHLYIVRHATKAINATTSYGAKHEIVYNDMV